MSHTAFCDFGFFSENMSFTQDLLHVYHQGVLCVVIAALVCSHIESSDPHITLKGLDTTLSKTVYGHYKRWCSGKGKAASSCSHRFNAARFGKEQWGAFPELGSIYKASVVKSMLFWCNQFLKEQVGKVAGATERANCIHAFAKFQYLLDINGPFLNDHQVGEAVKYARTGLLLYQDLAANDRSRDDGRRFYKLIPKFHSFFEMTIYMESSKRNPRLLGVVHSYFDF